MAPKLALPDRLAMRYSHVALEQRTRLWQTSWDRLGSQGMVRTVQVRSLDSNFECNYHGVFHRAFYSFRTLCSGECCYPSVCPRMMALFAVLMT